VIRWTEHKDHYRLDVSHAGYVALYGCLGASVAGTGLFIFGMLLFEGHLGRDAGWGGPIFLLALVGYVAWTCLSSTRNYRRECGWVEQTIRGGMARWGGPREPEMPSPIAVTRFESCGDGSGGFSIQAVLPDGLVQRVLGPWRHVPLDRIQRITVDLNANLETVEASRATVRSVAPTSDLGARPDIRAAIEAWSKHSGPYRFVIRDRQRALIKLIAGAFLSYLWVTNRGDWNGPYLYGVPVVAVWALAGAWFYHFRYAWVEVLSRGGRARCGRGLRVLASDVPVQSFEAVPSAAWHGSTSSWGISALLSDGTRIRVVRWPQSIPKNQAISIAYLLNWALTPPESSPEE